MTERGALTWYLQGKGSVRLQAAKEKYKRKDNIKFVRFKPTIKFVMQNFTEILEISIKIHIQTQGQVHFRQRVSWHSKAFLAFAATRSGFTEERKF